MEKYIKVPESIELLDKSTGKAVGVKLSFKEFVLGALLSDAKFAGPYSVIKKAAKIDKALEDMNGIMKLDIESWEMLKSVAENPSGDRYGTLTPLAMSQLIGFIEAIKYAADEPPAPVTA